MHKLILILGTGQGVLSKDAEKNYRTADYYFEDKPENIYTTPFIGEAIIKAKENEFDEVYILGTKDSMWDVLFWRAIENNLTEESGQVFEKLTDMLNKKKFQNDKNLITEVETELSRFYKVKTRIALIPVGIDEKEQWKMFSGVTDLLNENDALSIDITHGLRYQPMILTLALFYLKQIKNIEIKNVFYGAFELTGSYFDGKTPIMNLGSMTKMIDWTNAAFAFSHYGDSSALTNLLDAKKHKKLIDRAQYFTNVLQLNTVKEIRTNARKFKSKVLSANESEINEAFKIVKNEVIKLPLEIINTRSDWELMLLLSEKHWKNQQYGLAILAAWEAIIERIATILKIDVRNSIENYRKVASIAKRKKIFGDVAKTISNFRNAVAHAETEKSNEPNYIVKNFPFYFNQLKEMLTDEEIVKRISKIKV